MEAALTLVPGLPLHIPYLVPLGPTEATSCVTVARDGSNAIPSTPVAGPAASFVGERQAYLLLSGLVSGNVIGGIPSMKIQVIPIVR